LPSPAKEAKKKRAGDPARLSSSELDFIERLPRPAARLIARNKNDREVLSSLMSMVPILALGIVDLVDALFLLLDALGVLAAEVGEGGVTLVISASGTLSSSSSAKATVLPKARTRAMANAFIMGKSSKQGLRIGRNYPVIVSDI